MQIILVDGAGQVTELNLIPHEDNPQLMVVNEFSNFLFQALADVDNILEGEHFEYEINGVIKYDERRTIKKIIL